MDLLLSGLFGWLSSIIGTKIAVETPEEMNLKKIVFTFLALLNISACALILYAVRKIEIFAVVFTYLSLSFYQISKIKDSLILDKDPQFYKFFPLYSFLIPLISLMYATFVYSNSYFYILMLMLCLLVILLSLLETYYLISKNHPKTQFTTNSKFSTKETLNYVMISIIRYFPIFISFLILEVLLRV
ncbi:MAG: hypothetical protein QXD62_02545 [Candidatus Woesearchaeota archaeon]